MSSVFKVAVVGPKESGKSAWIRRLVSYSSAVFTSRVVESQTSAVRVWTNVGPKVLKLYEFTVSDQPQEGYTRYDACVWFCDGITAIPESLRCHSNLIIVWSKSDKSDSLSGPQSRAFLSLQLLGTVSGRVPFYDISSKTGHNCWSPVLSMLKRKYGSGTHFTPAHVQVKAKL